MPRELIRAPGHDRRLSLGRLAVEWMEHFCVHGPGDVQGERVVLDDELWEFTVDAYALVAGRGRRLYDSAFLSRAKGRDKSGHAARFVLFETLGPCRFDRWAHGGERYRWRDFTYTFEPGEPIGRPVTYPYVRCLATEEGQAGNTYDAVYFNLTEGPLAQGLSRNAAGLTRTLLPGGGEIVPSSASNMAKEGGKETFVVFDETHLYVTAELRKMYATVRRNLGKRKRAEPWSLETSTMYAVGEQSVAEETHKVAEAIREETTRSTRLLFDHRQAPADVDLTDEGEIRAALAEAYGPFAEVMDFDRILDEIWDPRNSPSDSRRFWLNQPSGAVDAWIEEPEWAAAYSDRPVPDLEVITLGFDGSRKRTRTVTDATALMACRVVDGHVFAPVETCVWEQPDGPAGQGWSVPKTEVEAAVAECFRRYTVVGFFADPNKWESTIAGWEAKYGRQLRKVRVTQGHPIEFWPTAIRMVPALEEFHSAIVDGEMTHDGSYALTRHVLNARRRPTRGGLLIAKEHPESPKKIDACIAAVLARRARLAAVAAGLASAKRFVPRRVR